MAATLQARYSTTQRLSGCCSGQVRPVVVMVVVMVVRPVAVVMVMVSMVCPPGDRRPHCRPAVVSRGSSAYLLLSCPSSADILSYQQ